LRKRNGDAGGAGERPRRRAHSPHRLEALTDGVFAIAMTILVLGIRVPEDALNPSQLMTALRDEGTVFIAFGVSFVLLGVYWFGQRSQYDYIRAVDRTLTWLNILFLLAISMIPFSASAIGRYPSFRVTVQIFGANLVACSALHAAIWWYATSPKRALVNPNECTPEIVRLGRRLSVTPLVFYIAAMALSFVDTLISRVMFALVPLLYLFDLVRKFHLPGRPTSPDALE